MKVNPLPEAVTWRVVCSTHRCIIITWFVVLVEEMFKVVFRVVFYFWLIVFFIQGVNIIVTVKLLC